MNKLTLKIASLKKALLTFEELIKESPTTIERDAAIQRFEYCFELSWKSLKEGLKEEGFALEELNSPRNVLKTGFQAGYINNDEIWIEMMHERNLTSHTYNEQLAKDIYGGFDKFHTAMANLLKQLESNFIR